MVSRAALLFLSLLPIVGGCKKLTAGRCVQPSITIDADYPGASPQQVEATVVRSLEAAVAPVSRHIAAVALPGHARLAIVPAGDGGVAARQAIVARLAAARDRLPADVDPPVVTTIDPAAPTELLAVRGADPAALTWVADAFRSRLLTRPGVQRVTLINPSRRELHIEVDPRRLDAFGLTLEEVATRIQSANVNLPSGSITAGARQVVVRTRGASPDDLGEIPIAEHASVPVYLHDLAQVEERLTNDARVRIDGLPAVLVEVVGPTKTVLAEVAAFDLPARIEIAPLGGLRPPPCDGPLISEQVPARARLELHLQLPDGSTLDTAEEALHQIERQLEPMLPAGATVLSIVGATAGSAGDGPNRAAVFVLADRPLAATFLRAAAAATVPGASLSVGGDGRRSALVRLRHPDLEVLRAAAGDLARTLEASPGVTAMTTPVHVDLTVKLSQRGRELGVTQAALATALRARNGGIDVGRLLHDGDREQLLLTTGRATQDVAELAGIPVPTAGGDPVPLGQVATLEQVAGPGQIERRDQQRVTYVQVRADRAIDLGQLVARAAGKLRASTRDLLVEPLR